MKNLELAHIFSTMADILEIKGDNPFKIRAYRRAALNLEELAQGVETLSRAELREIPGIGGELAAKIEEYCTTGLVHAHEKLLAEIPPGFPELLKVPGLGPKTARLLLEKTGVTDLDTLEQAAVRGELVGLPGVQEKTVENIRKGIARVRRGRPDPPLRAVLFDYGGVLAEEGFREGLQAIARSQGLDPATVHRAGMEAVYSTGYVLGQGSEADFWQALRQECGLIGEDEALSREILSRFVLRPLMLDTARSLRAEGLTVAILSDQTDWLERLDRRDGFMASFDRVFNSYCLGKGKLDPTLFDDVVGSLGVKAGEALFIDDLPGNVERAAARGLRTLLFRDQASFLDDLQKIKLVGQAVLNKG